jgi:hypothetical protein
MVITPLILPSRGDIHFSSSLACLPNKAEGRTEEGNLVFIIIYGYHPTNSHLKGRYSFFFLPGRED